MDLQFNLNDFLKAFKEKEPHNFMDIFKKISHNELIKKDNPLYNQIHTESKNISSFLDDSIKNFHLIFNKNLKDFEDCVKYIESISIPNKCVCAGVIDKIPGWRCDDCSKYENTLYCNDCYLKSKHLHKNHHVQFLYSSSGMCDCGDPDSLYVYCPEHSGPFKTQEQINDYLLKVFSKEILDKLKDFFKNLFSHFSKYLILTEKVDCFCPGVFEEKFSESDGKNNEDERKDVCLLKDNFCIIFQNLIHFLRLISENNIAMLHLISDYLLKNHFENQKIEDIYKTNHRCLQITDNDIKLMFQDGKEHICVCPFLRLFISNYRDDIECIDKNQILLLSFPHNLRLRTSFMITFFAIYRQIFLNANEKFLINRTQFYTEYSTLFLAQKSNLI